MTAVSQDRETCPLNYLLSNIGGWFESRNLPDISLRIAMAELLHTRMVQTAELLAKHAAPDDQAIQMTITVGQVRDLLNRLRNVIEALPAPKSR